MEVGALAGAIALLVAKDMASAMASEVGKDAAGAVKQVLGRLRGKLHAEPTTRAAVEQLQAAPNDLQLQAVLAGLLAAQLEANQALRAEVRVLVDDLVRAVLDPASTTPTETTPAGGGRHTMAEVLAVELEELERRAPAGLAGVPTGFPDLDRLTGGLQAGTLVIVAGPTAVGTTTLGLDIARHASIRGGIPTVFVSLDLTAAEVVNRLLCAEGSIDSQRLRLGRLDERDWVRLTRMLGRMGDAPLTIEASPTLTATQLTEACRHVRQHTGLGLVVVDEVSAVQPPRGTDGLPQERSDVVRSLKLLARELAVPVVALSRVAVQWRADPRPVLEDLPEVERTTADLVVLVHRPELDDPWSPRRGEADLWVAKHRAGPTGVVTVVFQGQYCRFAPIASPDL
jgi:replicative DNA helicase